MRVKISTAGKLTFGGRFDPLTGQIRVGDEQLIPRSGGSALPAAAGIEFVRSFSIGTAGDVVSAATLDAASHGLAGTWAPSRTPLEHTVLSDTSMVRHSPLALSGTDYDGTGEKAIKFDLDLALSNNSTPVWEQLVWNYTSADTEVSLTALVKFNTVAGGSTTAIDVFVIYCGGFAVCQFVHGADGQMSLHAHGEFSGSTSGISVPISPNTLYSVTLRKSSATEYGEVCVCDAATGVLVGVSRCKSTAGTLVSIILGESYLTFFGGYYEIGLTGLAVGTDANFPLGEPGFAVAAPATVVASQPGNDELLVLYGDDPTSAYTWKVERTTDGGAWVTLFEDSLSLSLSDTDVVNGSTYQYRITAKINAYVSPSTLSNSITVSNSSSSLIVNYDFEETGTPTGISPTGAINFDFTPALAGTESCQLDSTGGTAAIFFDVPDVGPELFVKLLFKNDASDVSSQVNFYLQDASFTNCCYILRYIDGTIYLADASGSVFVSTADPLADGPNYIWIHYRPATDALTHNGIVRVWHNTVDTRPADGSTKSAGSTAAHGTELVAHGSLVAATGNGVWVVDNIQMANSDF